MQARAMNARTLGETLLAGGRPGLEVLSCFFVQGRGKAEGATSRSLRFQGPSTGGQRCCGEPSHGHVNHMPFAGVRGLYYMQGL
jgi:hypothetical protein